MKHKNIYTALLVFITTLLFFTACNNDEVFRQKQISVLKANLEMLNADTKRVLNSYEVKKQNSPQIVPYYILGKRLSAVVVTYIDTNLNADYTDTVKLKERLTEFKTKYLYVLDSTAKAAQYPLFLKTDYEQLKSTNFNLITVSKTDSRLNYYFTIQNVILQHHKNLKAFINCIGSSCGWTYMYNFGYMVNIYQNNTSTQIKIYYSMPNANAKMQALKGAKIQAENEVIIPITGSKVQNDTTYITTNKLPAGNYKVLINYHIINEVGNEYTREFSFPFFAQ
ncbi:MAG TPA: hypothetical protein VKG26_03520 [Bacteroidia bacterium]|nr:hypothetical protein [Bacteroidia bacterium]